MGLGGAGKFQLYFAGHSNFRHGTKQEFMSGEAASPLISYCTKQCFVTGVSSAVPSEQLGLTSYFCRTVCYRTQIL